MKFLYRLALITGFLPFITFYSFGTDLQPWNVLILFLISIVLIMYGKFKIHKYTILLIIPFIISLVLLFIMNDFYYSIRSSLGYLLIFLSPLIYLYILKNEYLLFVKILKISTIILFVTGFIQLFINNSFGHILLSRMTTTLSRGVTSLTPEPTFYGIVCIFMILIFMNLNIKNKEKYIFILLLQIFFLAQSSMSILFVFIFIFFYLIFNLNIKSFFAALIMLIVAFLIFNNIDLLSYNNRILHLIYYMFNNPFDIFYNDASLNDRLSSIYFSFKGSFDNYLLLQTVQYPSYLESELQITKFFDKAVMTNRIMSYYGTMIYELGIFGLLIPITYSLIIFKMIKNKRFLFTHLFFINTILFSAIQITFPLVGIYFATLLFKEKNV